MEEQRQILLDGIAGARCEQTDCGIEKIRAALADYAGQFPAEDPGGLKVFDCPRCSVENAVLEDDAGFHCRACNARFWEADFDDPLADTYYQDDDAGDGLEGV